MKNKKSRVTCAEWMMSLLGEEYWREQFGNVGYSDAKHKLETTLRIARLFARRKK